MTPIYGRPAWHNPRATVVPLRATNAQKWHGRHEGGTHPAPPFEAFYRVNQAGGTSGTTARIAEFAPGDVGKTMKIRNIYISRGSMAFGCAVVPYQNAPGHIWG